MSLSTVIQSDGGEWGGMGIEAVVKISNTTINK